jgi:hypothetical protein
VEEIIDCQRKPAYNIHVYVILAEEHKAIFSIFNNHQQVYEAVVFQMPVLHKHV